jgi:hypothetical protein
MKTYVGVEVELHAFLIPAQDEGERLDSRPGNFTLEDRVPGNPLDRKLGETQSRSGGVGEEKSLPLQGIESRWFSPYPSQ